MLQYWIWLTTRKGLNSLSVLKLLEYFSTPEDIFRASPEEYRRAGVNERACQALADKSLKSAREILSKCALKGIHILTYQDAAYPERLRNISDPPAVLYYLGALPQVDDEPAVAVIGSRKSSAYGLTCARRMGHQIAACGGLVVSGLAEGGDAAAMQGALSASRPVIGVLGGGVDVIYPKCNRRLYADVRRYGCLISEYPPGTPSYPGHFPARNRIISGLALGVVVTEAPEHSGTFITVRHALDQGRDVFAVPGNIDVPSTVGSNSLLKEGAIVAETGWDVMREYEALYPGRIVKRLVNLPHIPNAPLPELPVEVPMADKKDVDNGETNNYIDVQAILDEQSQEERRILLQLSRGPQHVDQLVSGCGTSAGQILSSLTLLEIKKYVQRLPGNRYELARRP